MKFSDIMDIAASGLRAQRTRMTVTASNIANAQTTRTREGGPYRRRDPVFEAERIGIVVNEDTGFQFQPEQSTSAIVCHHPKAKYFVAR